MVSSLKQYSIAFTISNKFINIRDETTVRVGIEPRKNKKGRCSKCGLSSPGYDHFSERYLDILGKMINQASRQLKKKLLEFFNSQEFSSLTPQTAAQFSKNLRCFLEESGKILFQTFMESHEDPKKIAYTEEQTFDSNRSAKIIFSIHFGNFF